LDKTEAVRAVHAFEESTNLFKIIHKSHLRIAKRKKGILIFEVKNSYESNYLV